MMLAKRIYIKILLPRILFVCIAVSMTCGVAGAAEFVKPAIRDKCPVCGMFVAKYPKWVAEIVFKDGSHAVFDGCKDLFKYYFNVKKYDRDKKKDDIAGIFVTEYYTTKIMTAGDVYFVVGSDVLGPMGHEFIPVKGKEDAETFMLDHKGKKMFRFDEITPEEIPK